MGRRRGLNGCRRGGGRDTTSADAGVQRHLRRWPLRHGTGVPWAELRAAGTLRGWMCGLQIWSIEKARSDPSPIPNPSHPDRRAHTSTHPTTHEESRRCSRLPEQPACIIHTHTSPKVVLHIALLFLSNRACLGLPSWCTAASLHAADLQCTVDCPPLCLLRKMSCWLGQLSLRSSLGRPLHLQAQKKRIIS